MSFVQRILSLYIQHQESMPQADKHINFDDLFRYNYRPLCLYALHYLQEVDVAEDMLPYGRNFRKTLSERMMTKCLG